MKILPLIVSAILCISPVQEPLQTLKVDVEIVQVYATVTDESGRFVTGLTADNFHIDEDKVEQKIDSFSSDDVPVSVAIVLDVNGVMGDNFLIAKEAAQEFLKAGHLENEYFVVEFNSKAEVTQDYTHDITVLKEHQQTLRRNRLLRGTDHGDFDAMYLALQTLKTASNPKKVLLMFTTGGDIKGEHKAAEVRNLARQQDVQIYGISIVDTQAQAGDETSGFDVIETAGGEAFAASTTQDFLSIGKKLAVGVRNQYILSYHPANPVHDGKYRHIQVKLTSPKGSDLFVHTREGYFARGPEGK